MTMGIEILLSLVLILVSHLQFGDSGTILSIGDFISDPNATDVDHSRAFQAAWKATCGGRGSLVVQAHERYTIRPQFFQGPCASPNIHIQIDGKIEAPKSVRDWGNTMCWLCFNKVTGLSLTGSGTLHSHGEVWWSSRPSSRPQALKFNGCQNILYSGLTQINGPKNHISISGSTNITLSYIHIIAPQNSPNTDGIDITGSRSIRIQQSSIKTGDDCIAIHCGAYDINITSVACGPGHGISVGSLGKRGATDIVQNVNVRHCTFIGTQNAARIKTWPGGRGFAKNILYEDITLVNSRTPIRIDQYYPNGKEPNQATAVKVSDVTFRSFRGTSADAVAIFIDCDQKTGCDNIVMDHIQMTSSYPGTHLTAYCKFAHVIKTFVPIPINCVNHGHLHHLHTSAPAPAPYATSPTPLPAPAPYATAPTPFPAPTS